MNKEKIRKGKKAKNVMFALSAGTALLLTGGLMTACDGNTGVSVTNVAFYSGEENPTAETGKVGDFYYETDACNLWLRNADGWVVVSSLKGAQGEKGEKGEAGTPGQKGAAGESAYQSYRKSGGQLSEEDWIASMPGAPGAAGTQILTGTVAPTAAANVGDLYINTTTGDLYKYTANGWGEPILSMKGTPGQQGEPGQAGVGIDNFDVAVNEVGVLYTVSYTQGQQADRFLMADNGETYKLKRGSDIDVDDTTIPGMTIYTFTTTADETVSLISIENYGVARYYAVDSAADLQSALSSTGGVINVMDNIADIPALNITNNAMILLNGNTLTFASTDPYVIRNEAGNALMIQNGAISYTSSITLSATTSLINNFGQLMMEGVDIELNNIYGHSADAEHEAEAVGRIDGIANWGAGEVSIRDCQITMDTNVDDPSKAKQYKTCGIFNLGEAFEFVDSILNVEINVANSSYAIYNYINIGETDAGTRAFRIEGSTINVTSTVRNSLSGIFAESYELDPNTAIINIGADTVVNVTRDTTDTTISGKNTYALRAKGNATINGANNATLNITDPTGCTQIERGMEENDDGTTGSYGVTGVIND